MICWRYWGIACLVIRAMTLSFPGPSTCRASSSQTTVSFYGLGFMLVPASRRSLHESQLVTFGRNGLPRRISGSRHLPHERMCYPDEFGFLPRPLCGVDPFRRGPSNTITVEYGKLRRGPRSRTTLGACEKDGDGSRLNVVEGSLRSDVEESPVRELLRGTLGMSEGNMQVVLAKCDGLDSERGLELAREAVAFFRGQELKLRAHEVRKLVLKDPRVLRLPVETRLVPQTQAWLEAAGLGLSRKELGKMAVECPKVFTAEYSTLAVTVHWLRTAFGLTAEKVATVLADFPSLLSLDLEAELRPRHRWMVETLGLDQKDARRVITLTPEVLAVSMEDTLVPSCAWIERRSVGKDMTSVGRVVTKCPYLLMESPEVMEDCFARMVEVLFEGERGAAAEALMMEQPVLVLLSDRLEVLVDLITRELGATLEEVRDTLKKDPSILEFRLEERVFPRLEAMRAEGVGDVDMGKPLSLAGKLKILGKNSESRFSKWMARETAAKLARDADLAASFVDDTQAAEE